MQIKRSSSRRTRTARHHCDSRSLKLGVHRVECVSAYLRDNEQVFGGVDFELGLAGPPSPAVRPSPHLPPVAVPGEMGIDVPLKKL